MKQVRNKLLAGGCAVCMLLSALPMQSFAAYAANEGDAATLRGDVNGDGKIDQVDLEALTTLIGENLGTILTEEKYLSYDITGEGIIDVRDQYALKQYLSGAAEFPEETSVQLDDTMTLMLTGAECFPGEEFQIMLSAVDWTKDIAAYDVVIGYNPVFELENVEFLSGDGQYMQGSRSVRLSCLYDAEEGELWRGDLAVLTFKATGEASGSYSFDVEGSNIFASDYNYYTSVKPSANVMVGTLFEPVSLTASAVGSKTVSLEWSMPFATQAVQGYVVYRDGKKIAETEDTFYTDREVTTDTDYVYTVSAITENSVETAQSVPLNVHTAAPKIVSAEFPQNKVTINNSDLTVTLEQPIPVAEMELEFTAPDGKVTTDKVTYTGSDLETITYHWDVSELDEGEYGIKITITDIDDATGTESITATVYDTAPKALEIKGYSGSHRATLTWNIAVEADAIGYRVYRKTAENDPWELISTIQNRSTTTFADTNLSPKTTYYYMVKAYDSYGLEGAESNVVEVTPSVDQHIPEIVMFSVANGSRLYGDVPVTIEASDDNAVDHVECLISADNGETWTKIFEEDGKEGVWTLDSTEYEDGIYKLKAMAYDEDGLASSGATIVSVQLDNTAPEQVQNLRMVEVYPTQATIAWDDVADEDFSYFKVVYTTGSTVSSATVSKNLGYNFSGLVPDTRYTVTVYAVDQTGNIGQASKPLTFITNSDVTPPVITYFSVSPSLLHSGQSLTVYVTASDTASIRTRYLEYSQDQENWRRTSQSGTRYNFSLGTGSFEEGKLYLRAYAEDIYGNIGDRETAPVTSVTIDNTAPEAPTELTAAAQETRNVLQWAASVSEDASYYEIYRAVETAPNSYSQLATIYSSNKSYTDSNIKVDTTYYYKVRTIDKAGNYSDFTDPIEVKRVPDVTAPTIEKCDSTASSGIITAGHQNIQAILNDDVQLSSNNAMYYRLSETAAWTKLTTSETAGNARMTVRLTAVLPDTVLTADKVYIKVYAEDARGNKAEKEFSFPIDDHQTEVTDFTAVSGDSQVTLSWKCETPEEISNFRILRKIDSGTEYQVASMSATQATEYSYADKQLDTSGKYTYRLAVYMKTGKIFYLTADSLQIQGIPKASLVCDTSQILGASYSYDATGSKNANEIVKVTIDFGDKNTKTVTSVKKALFEHTYAEAGTYTVVLTCENADGLSASKSVKVTVSEPSQVAEVTGTVRSTDGNVVSGIAVYVDVGTDNQSVYYTDANGVVKFDSIAGTHEIGVFGDGYLPVTKTCTFIAGAENTVDFAITKNELIEANFNITRMTLEEIKAAGIKVEDPANCQIVQIDINLEYRAPEGYTTDHITIIYDKDTDNYKVLPYWLEPEEGGNGQPTHIYTIQPLSKTDDTLVLMRIPAQTQFLKEFFNVEMIVMNNADSQFSVDNCDVTLNLPQGLTLMSDAKGSNPATVHKDKIAGKSQWAINWIVRGDKNGTYEISADFNGTLAKFNETISKHFIADDKIKVYGQEAAKITVNVDTAIRSKGMLVEMLVENDSPIDLYEVQTSLGDILSSSIDYSTPELKVSIYQTRFIGKNGILEVIDNTEHIETLKPGEKFSVLYRITGYKNEFAYKILRILTNHLSYTSTSQNVTVKLTSNLGAVDTNSIFYGIAFDPDHDYLFSVINKAKQEIAGATVQIIDANGNVTTKVADDRGRVVVPRKSADENFKLKVTAEGYKDFNDNDYQFPYRQTQNYERITLAGDIDEADYKLKSARLYINNHYECNLLQGSATLREDEQDEFEIRVEAEQEADHFELYQGDKKIMTENTPGTKANFVVPMSKVDLGKYFKVRVYSETGDPVTSYIHLEIAASAVSSGTRMARALIDDSNEHPASVTIETPKKIADWGGSFDLTITFPDLTKFGKFPKDLSWDTLEEYKKEQEDSDSPVEIEISTDGVTISIDINDNDSMEVVISKENGISISVSTSRDIDIPKGDFGISLGFELNASEDTDTGAFVISGTVSFEAEASAEFLLYQHMTPPFFVAVTISGEFGLSAGLSYSFNYLDNAASGFGYSIEGEGRLGVRLDLDFGVHDVAEVGIYGDVGFNMSGVLASSEEKPHFKRIWFDGSIGLHTEVLEWWEYDMELFSGYINVLGQEGDERPSIVRFAEIEDADGESVLVPVTNANQYQAMSADKIQTSGDFNGVLENRVNTLQTELTPSAAPVLVTDGTTTMLVWVVKDATRGTANAAYVVFSIYDEATKTWSAPAAVDDNTNADTAPVLFVGVDGIRLAYQQSGTVIEDASEITLDDYAKQMTFATARFDAAKGKFDDFRTIEVNAEGGYASAPAFVQSADGTTYLFWKSNANGLLFGTDDSNQIMYAEETAEGWSEATVLAKDLPMVTSFAVGTLEDGTVACAYVVDNNSSAAESDDRTLYAVALDGTTTVLQEGTVSAPQFAAAPDNNEKGIVWYADGALNISKNISEYRTIYDGTVTGLTDRYYINGNQIMYLHSTGNGTGLYSVSYVNEDEGFTAPVCVEANEGVYYDNLTMANLNGDLLYAMTATTTAEDDLLNLNTALVGGILGQTSDLRLANATYKLTSAVANQEFPMNVTVENRGTTDVTTLKLAIQTEAGLEIASATEDVTLRSGETKTVQFKPVLPEDFTPGIYTAVISTDADDRTPADNEKAIDVNMTDLSITATRDYFDDATVVTIVVKNNSNVASAAMVRAIDQTTGEETIALVSEPIEPSKAAIWQISSDDLLGSTYHGFVTLIAESEITDTNLRNNTQMIALSKNGFDPSVSGDVNLDGSVDVMDATLALQCYVASITKLKKLPLTSTQQKSADVDTNGAVDIIDATIILYYYVDCITAKREMTFTEYLSTEWNGGKLE